MSEGDIGESDALTGAEPSEYSEPQLEGGSLSCAARDWEVIPLEIAAKFASATKTLDLSYNLLKYFCSFFFLFLFHLSSISFFFFLAFFVFFLAFFVLFFLSSRSFYRFSRHFFIFHLRTCSLHIQLLSNLSNFFQIRFF